MNLIYSFMGYSTATVVNTEEKKDILNNRVNENDKIEPSERESDTDWEMLLKEENTPTVSPLNEGNPTNIKEDPSISTHSNTAANEAQLDSNPQKIISNDELSDKQKELLNKLEADATDYNAYCDLAATLSGKLRIQIGEEHLDQKRLYLKATQINSNNAKAFFQLVLLLEKEDKIAYVPLEKALIKVISINPQHIKAFELLGKHFDHFKVVDETIKLKDGTMMTRDQIFNKVAELKRTKPSHFIKA